MSDYPDPMPLDEARALFFRLSGLGDDGGYGARWVRVESKPIPFFFPNTWARVAAARLHDLHHVATGYAADWPGEAEIAAWEIASGCGRHLWAWLLNLGAFTVGMALVPRRLFRAFVRGRHSRNLYREGFADARLGHVTVGALRKRLGLAAPPPPAHTGDVLAFAAWCAAGLAWHGLFAAAGLLLAWLLLRPLAAP
ncbi:MAG TPA: hypothetical protein VFX98_17555 [Longimicrobiaceae bacterium]|nr:hypothetical protein [Longimicrobiaceae bacterium]